MVGINTLSATAIELERYSPKEERSAAGIWALNWKSSFGNESSRSDNSRSLALWSSLSNLGTINPNCRLSSSSLNPKNLLVGLTVCSIGFMFFFDERFEGGVKYLIAQRKSCRKARSKR